jgi:Domain of unknown function (DUF1929)/Galactose oxidase, central domain
MRTLLRSFIEIVLLAGLWSAAPPSIALAVPTPRHPGQWSAPRYFGRDSAHANVAINLLLLRGASGSHSFVLGFGWDGTPSDSLVSGALWGWNPASEDCDAALQSNFTLLPLGSPPYNPHASGATVLPDGNVLILGGDEGQEVGVSSCALFHRDTHTFSMTDSTEQRHFNGTSTLLADGRVLASGGIMFSTVFAFGGRADGAALPDGRLRTLQLTRAGAWSPVQDPAGMWPSAREGHSLCALGSGPSLLFGGRAGDGSVLGDTWMFSVVDADDGQPHAWSLLGTIGAPSPRTRHAAAVINSPAWYLPSMILFGGEDGAGQSLGDLWRLRFDSGWKWSLLSSDSVSGPPPTAHSGTAAAYAPAADLVLVTGGRGADGSLADSLWVLAAPGGKPVWKRPVWLTPQHPAGRWRHALASDTQLRTRSDGRIWARAFLYGGLGVSGRLGDLWTLWVSPSGDSAEWAPLNPAGTTPAPRSDVSLLYYDIQDRLIVLGGDTGGVTDPIAWSLLPPAPSSNWQALSAAGSSLVGMAAVVNPSYQIAILPEIYDPIAQSWTTIPAPHLQLYYPFMHVISAQEVFEAGPTTNRYMTWSFNPLAQTWQRMPTDTSQLDGGADVLFRPGQVMKSGNRSVYGTASSEARWIDLTSPSPHWRRTANPMAFGRTTHQLTLLPDGQVLCSGGTLTGELSTAVHRPELWDPEWTAPDGSKGWWYGGFAPDTLAADTMVRGYHSTAVLLPDGRVLSAGGIFDPAHDVKMNLYCPPYLFNADGTAALRPRITSSPAVVSWGETFTVESPDSFVGVSLVRPASSTHGTGMDQRWIPLTRVGGASPAVQLLAPADGGVAPPGDYLLFLVGPNGAPSISRWITVGGPAPADVSDRGERMSPWLSAAPNPFAATTTLRFRLGERGPARLDIVDIAGRLVRRLIDGTLTAETHVIEWDGRDDRRAPVRPGVYLMVLRARGKLVSQRVVVVR